MMGTPKQPAAANTQVKQKFSFTAGHMANTFQEALQTVISWAYVVVRQAEGGGPPGCVHVRLYYHGVTMRRWNH